MIPARFPAVEKSDWPGLIGHRIMRLDFTAVVSPALAASIGGIHRPADLLRLPIISPGDPWWKQWFRHAGVANPDLGSRPASDYGVQPDGCSFRSMCGAMTGGTTGSSTRKTAATSPKSEPSGPGF